MEKPNKKTRDLSEQKLDSIILSGSNVQVDDNDPDNPQYILSLNNNTFDLPFTYEIIQDDEDAFEYKYYNSDQSISGEERLEKSWKIDGDKKVLNYSKNRETSNEYFFGYSLDHRKEEDSNGLVTEFASYVVNNSICEEIRLDLELSEDGETSIRIGLESIEKAILGCNYFNFDVRNSITVNDKNIVRSVNGVEATDDGNVVLEAGRNYEYERFNTHATGKVFKYVPELGLFKDLFPVVAEELELNKNNRKYQIEFLTVPHGELIHQLNIPLGGVDMAIFCFPQEVVGKSFEINVRKLAGN